MNLPRDERCKLTDWGVKDFGPLSLGGDPVLSRSEWTCPCGRVVGTRCPVVTHAPRFPAREAEAQDPRCLA